LGDLIVSAHSAALICSQLCCVLRFPGKEWEAIQSPEKTAAEDSLKCANTQISHGMTITLLRTHTVTILMPTRIRTTTHPPKRITRRAGTFYAC
jgi:hypothetical protein